MSYNLACAFAQTGGATEDAISALRSFCEGIQTAQNIRHLESDPDLDPLRDDPGYKEMLSSAKERLGIRTDADA